MKKLIPALALLLVSAVMLATSSFAWFSMNTTVTVTGMEVKTRVSDNLFVAKTTLDATTKVADANYGSFINDMTPAETLLEPVSTVDGKAFFYTNSTSNVNADGSAKIVNQETSFIAYAEGDAFDANYGVDDNADAKGYVDYVMELKAVNGTRDPKNIKLTRLNLTYKGVETAQKAFRVAVFTQKFNGEAYTMKSEETLGNAVFFGYAGSTYFNGGKAVSAVDTLSTAPTLTTTGVSLEVAAGKTEYFKVVVRVWLEGQDTTCNNDTFASLTKNWALDIAFELGTTTSAATNIGTAAIVADASGVTLTDGKLSNGETPAATNAYVWYNALTGAVVDGATTADAPAATATAGTYYCVVATVKGNTYVTNNITVPAQQNP